jgi:hypothetical protein
VWHGTRIKQDREIEEKSLWKVIALSVGRYIIHANSGQNEVETQRMSVTYLGFNAPAIDSPEYFACTPCKVGSLVE